MTALLLNDIKQPTNPFFFLYWNQIKTDFSLFCRFNQPLSKRTGKLTMCIHKCCNSTIENQPLVIGFGSSHKSVHSFFVSPLSFGNAPFNTGIYDETICIPFYIFTITSEFIVWMGKLFCTFKCYNKVGMRICDP